MRDARPAAAFPATLSKLRHRHADCYRSSSTAAIPTAAIGLVMRIALIVMLATLCPARSVRFNRRDWQSNLMSKMLRLCQHNPVTISMFSPRHWKRRFGPPCLAAARSICRRRNLRQIQSRPTKHHLHQSQLIIHYLSRIRALKHRSSWCCHHLTTK